MAFDLDAFSKELGLTADELGQVKTILDKPDRLAALEKNQLRQTDYSKNMDALKKAQTDLESAQNTLKTQSDRLTGEMAEWATLTAAEKEGATKLRGDLESTQQKVLKLQQRITAIATDNGLDVTKALEGIDQVVTPPVDKNAPLPIDTSKFVNTDQFVAMNNYLFTLQTELPMLMAEHHQLTGQSLDTRKLSAEIIKRSSTKGANVDPRVVWEELFGIPAIRETKAKTDHDAEIAAAVERGRTEARSEASLPIPPQNGQHSPVLRTADGQPHQSKLKRPQHETAVAAAASAFATGKYRQQPAGKTT